MFAVAFTACLSSSFAASQSAAPVIATQTAPAQQAPEPQPGAAPAVIHVTAVKYRFDPSPIHVKNGATVELHITASDRAHGFLVNAYPDKAAAPESPGLVFSHPQNCWRIAKGQEVVIEFVVRRPGSYAFRCCVFCGLGHLGMKGEIIVDP
jgi:heme/copper-type cytochrome/quinol oxidase subunit 2